MILFKLAIGNIKKYYKHYIVVTLITFLSCTGVLTYLFSYENNYNYQKQETINKYGSWYGSSKDIGECAKSVQQTIHDQNLNAGFVYNDTTYHGYTVGSISDQMYDLARITILQGNAPSSENEIMVSESYAQNENVNIKDIVKINNTTFTISAIYSTKNDFIPDIINTLNVGSIDLYTDSLIVTDMNSSIGTFKYTVEDEHGNKTTQVLYCEMNENGYNADTTFSTMYFVNDIYIFVIEALLIAGFILVALTNTSLKRRNQEFALFRGIGMTSIQLFMMVFIENALIVLFSIIGGSIASVFATKFYINIYKGIHNFNVSVSPISMMIYALMLGMIILIISIIPAFNSAKQPLSGYFGEGKFKYFQVHYKKLKTQTKLRLAKRELSVNNKMTIVYLIFSFIVMFYCLTFVYKGHVESRTFENNQHHFGRNQNNGGNYYGTTPLVDVNTALINLNENTISTKYISDVYCSKGEIVNIGEYTNELTIIDGEVPKELEVVVGDNYEDIHIGDQLIINDTEYTVSGIVSNTLSNTVDAYINHINEDEMTGYAFNIHYTDYDTSVELEEALAKLATNYNNKFTFTNDNAYYHRNGSGSTEVNFDDYCVDLKYVIVPIILGIIICFILNMNDIMNNIKDYAAYQLIGMSKKELVLKQWCKAVVMTGYNIVFMIAIILMLVASFNVDYFPILQLLLIIIGYFVAFSVIYVAPSFVILKTNMLEMVKTVD